MKLGRNVSKPMRKSINNLINTPNRELVWNLLNYKLAVSIRKSFDVLINDPILDFVINYKTT